MRVQANNAGTADQRREQMLRAALDVIAERGYPESRIADVAERAGTSPALVIYYFKTKDQLLTEAIRFSEDSWYEAGMRRMAEIPTAAGKLEEIVAMSCLPEADSEPAEFLGALARPVGAGGAPSRGGRRAAEVRRAVAPDSSARSWWTGQEAGEFGPVDPVDFAVLLSALLDGLAVQIALADPAVDAHRAYELSMQFAAGQLGFTWSPQRRAGGLLGSRVRRGVINQGRWPGGWRADRAGRADQAIYRGRGGRH